MYLSFTTRQAQVIMSSALKYWHSQAVHSLVRRPISVRGPMPVSKSALRVSYTVLVVWLDNTTG